MAITGIEAVTFGVESVEDSIKFLDDFGLVKIKDSDDEAVFRCADGSRINIYHHADPRLPDAVNCNLSVREIVWGVENVEDLESLGEKLSRDRPIEIEANNKINCVDDIGLSIGIAVSGKKAIDPDPAIVNTPGNDGRINTPATFYKRAIPQMFSHIVFGVPDHRVVEEFYCSRLGFRPTDRYTDRGVFLRCAEKSNHHNFFAMNIDSEHAQFNHLAFKVRDVHEVIGGGQYLNAQGWATQVGPETFSEWTFNATEEFNAPTAASKAKWVLL